MAPFAAPGEGSGGLSWTRTGALIAADNSPSRVFARLFLDGNAEDVQEQIRHLEDGRSILDDVSEQANSLRSYLGSQDRDKLDEYLTSVRELEQRMVKNESWAKKPKPKVNVEPPKDIPNAADLIGRTSVFLGSNLGDSSSHSTKNLPVLVEGGGVQHGQHLAFDIDNPPPLCNLYVNMLQRLGIETDKFGTSTGTLTGLELSRDSSG